MGAPVTPNDGAYLSRAGEPATLSWIGQASWVIHDGRDVVLTDPHWGPRALLPKRLAPPGLPLAAVPAKAFALLSHNHYDHLDEGTVRRLPAGVDWYAPLGLGAWLGRRARGAVREMDWWEETRRGRWTITCLPAQHWSNRLGMARNSTLWCGWLLDNGERRYYFAGDSGYHQPLFAEIGRRFPGIDVAFLPVGSYEPRWFMQAQHMNPPEAWRAFQDLRARILAGMHWGTFDLTDEPADEGPRALRASLSPRELESVHLPSVGERRRISRS
jgi:N-acyl-phosphatidylethanolamine-hydrolysing phospholipase D